MKRLLLSVVLVATGLPLAALATDAYYINSGVVLNYGPQIDATNFVNEAGGVFNIISSASLLEPFDTSNTQNFTNKGSLTSTIGWLFDTAPSGNGVRHWASSFRNYPSASVTAADGGILVILGGAAGTAATSFPAKLIVHATNVVVEGYMTTGSEGILSIVGKNVNLSRGGLQVLPLIGRGDAVVTGTNQYFPDVGLTDDYWGVVTNNLNSANILISAGGGFASAASPTIPVQFPGGVAGTAQVVVNNGPAFVYTNAIPPTTITVTNEIGETNGISVSTNITIQAAFVSLSDPNIGLATTFYPSTISTNLFSTITVGMSTTVPNPVTGGSDTLQLYLVDTLASETNHNLSQNLIASPPTYRPGSYVLSRLPPLQFVLGNPPNSTVTPTTLYDPDTFSNATVRAIQTGYSATAGTIAGQQPIVPAADLSNAPGRLEITADALDLTRTRIRTDGLVTLNTDHLISSSNAVMDALNVTFFLGSTNGNLRIHDLALDAVPRFAGTIYCWSGVWTNAMTLVLPNYSAVVTNMSDPNDPTNMISVTNYVEADLTNTITIGLHSLILNASGLSTRPLPVTTHDFVAKSTNVFIDDPLTIANTFFTDAQQMTIDDGGGVTLVSRILPIDLSVVNQNWTAANAPNLLYFTNAGTLSVPNEGHFGDDRTVPYSTFVNKATATGFAFGLSIRSKYFENSGTIQSGGLLSVNTVTGEMEDAQAVALGDVRVQAQDFKFLNSDTESSGTLYFTITNSLTDSGPDAQVTLHCGDGFQFAFANATGKPQTGDLLGTTLSTDVPIFAFIPHVWPGNDFGVSAMGFTNNLALGHLSINVDAYAEAFFSGTGDSNGLYVDFLNFSGMSTTGDVASAISTAPNLTIYFADSNLPAEQLDGLLGGHLRWVSSYAGPNSSVAVVINGQTVLVNKALRNSKVIDSNNNGIPNYYDPSPFDEPPLTLAASMAAQGDQPSSSGLAISWQAAPNTVYQVEYATDVPPSEWYPLLTYTNAAPTNRVVTIWDTNAPAGAPKRLYRVSYSLDGN